MMLNLLMRFLTRYQHYHNQKQTEIKFEPGIKIEPQHAHCYCCSISMGKITRPLTRSYVTEAGRV